MVGRRYPDEIFSFLRGAGCLNGPGPAERLSELRRCGDRGDKDAERRFLASPVSFARLIWGAGKWLAPLLCSNVNLRLAAFLREFDARRRAAGSRWACRGGLPAECSCK